MNFRDVLDANLRAKLSRGLPTTIVLTAAIYRAGQNEPRVDRGADLQGHLARLGGGLPRGGAAATEQPGALDHDARGRDAALRGGSPLAGRRRDARSAPTTATA